MTKYKDITGQRFNNLTVLRYYGSNYRGDAEWYCKCDCGEIAIVIGSQLRNGHTKSCGCLQKEWTSTNKPHTTHGLSEIPEFKVWVDIRRRCNPKNANNPKYSLYAGRGIKVCNRWLNSFENFYEDMGDRPTPYHSIERKDNNGDYTPENCRWATDIEQANNRRSNILLTWNGKTQTITQWGNEVGINPSVLRDRYHCGWSVERLLTEKVREW